LRFTTSSSDRAPAPPPRAISTGHPQARPRQVRVDPLTAACARLLAIADGLTGRRIELEPIVALDEWFRATKTYRAAVMVAATGYGQQAQVPARSVLESAMLISWAMRHPREADEQVQLHTLLRLGDVPRVLVNVRLCCPG
jgi:hypothetical protein